MVRTVAFVGAGPTTIYTLCAFVDETTAPARVTIFEAQPRARLVRLGIDPDMIDGRTFYPRLALGGSRTSATSRCSGSTAT